MKILFLTNNDISHSLAKWLQEEAFEEVILYSNRLSKDNLREITPDLIISYNYRYIIKEDVLNFYLHWIINLHISLLPWNKGAHPNLWSFLDNTPKGVTIHLIDKGIDSGLILLQKEISFVEERETLETSYKTLHKEIQKLFKENWGRLKSYTIQPVPQYGKGSMHYKRDLEKISAILGEKEWKIPILEMKKNYAKLK